MTKTHRIGIIGCGWAGDRHANALAALKSRAELCAVTDVDSDIAQGCAKRYNVSHWTTDYQEVLSPEILDAVVIALPHHLHAAVTIEAVEAGLHVLVEKPLATSLSEADAMIAAAEQAGVQLMVAENVRYDNTYIKAAERVRSGALGRLYLVRISREHHMHDYLHRRPWFLKDEAAGIMFSGGIHDFELLRLLAGEIEHVYGLTAPKSLSDMVADDTSVVVAELEGGASAILVESFSLRTPHPGVHGTVHGSDGSLWFHNDRIRLYTAAEDGQSEMIEEINVPARDTFEAEMTHFLDCIKGDNEPITSGREERKPLVAVLATYESIRRGERVYLADFETHAANTPSAS